MGSDFYCLRTRSSKEKKSKSAFKATERNVLEIRMIQPNLEDDSARETAIKFRIIPNDTKEFHGDCLFMALAQFLHPESDPKESLKYHRMIRKSIVKFLTQDPHGNLSVWLKYNVFLKYNHEARIEEFREYSVVETSRPAHMNIMKAYKRYMLKRGNFGTMSELYAAMELFGFRTTVIQESTAENRFDVYDIGSYERSHHLYLLFTGPEDGGHFQCLEAVSKSEEIPIGKYDIVTRVQLRSFYVLSKTVTQDASAMVSAAVGVNKRKSSSLVVEMKHWKVSREEFRFKNDPKYYRRKKDFELKNLDLSYSLSVVSDNYTKSRPRSPESDDVDSSGSETSTNGTATTLVSSDDISEVELNYQPPVYVWLPPWTATPRQTLHSRVRIHVKENCAALLDVFNPNGVGKPRISIKRGTFYIEANSTYTLKNFQKWAIIIQISAR